MLKKITLFIVIQLIIIKLYGQSKEFIFKNYEHSRWSVRQQRHNGLQKGFLFGLEHEKV